MAKKLTFYILMGMMLGIVVGAGLHFAYTGSVLTAPAEIAADAKTALEGLGKYFGLVTDIFLRMIKMIIAPLVFATLVSGIVHMGDTAALGRVGAKTIIWFLGATVVSLTLGAVLVNFIQPGAGGGFTLPPADATAGIVKPDSDIFKIIAEMFPRSIVEGMANNTILQIVIFSLFFGVAMTASAAMMAARQTVGKGHRNPGHWCHRHIPDLHREFLFRAAGAVADPWPGCLSFGRAESGNIDPLYPRAYPACLLDGFVGGSLPANA